MNILKDNIFAQFGRDRHHYQQQKFSHGNGMRQKELLLVKLKIGIPYLEGNPAICSRSLFFF